MEGSRLADDLPRPEPRSDVTTLWRWLARFCVAMLIVVVTAYVLLWLLPALGFCSNINTGGAACPGPISQGLAEFALSVLILSVFTGIPVLLALIGAVILCFRVVRHLRRR